MKDDILEDDDFEQLLDSFINSSPDSENENNKAAPSQKNKIANDSDDDFEDAEDDLMPLDEEDEAINQDIDEQNLGSELFGSLSEAKQEALEADNAPTLGNDESELAQAFVNFYTSVNHLSKKILKKEFKCVFEIDDLYPNYKPSTGLILSNDLVAGWLLLVKMFPKEMKSFPPSSSDEEFLSFAETLSDSDLQLAVISYVEILIDMESCELTYQAKFLRYQEKHIRQIMYEEYLARKERQRKFTEALKKKGFPVDAERLIANYFRVAQKDIEGAFRALTTNPAIFAPIDFSKIKPRLFGLIKVSPKDGIRINTEMGNFLKKLKV